MFVATVTESQQCAIVALVAGQLCVQLARLHIAVAVGVQLLEAGVGAQVGAHLGAAQAPVAVAVDRAEGAWYDNWMMNEHKLFVVLSRPMMCRLDRQRSPSQWQLKMLHEHEPQHWLMHHDCKNGRKLDE